MKYLSIIIPVYNVENYLAKCLDSVIYPDLEEYEIVTVNDGSTDSSAEILEDYQKRYPNIVRIITKENGGLGSARNAAIEPAEGEFLYFLDSDDYLSPRAVREMVDTCRHGGFDVCFFDAVAVNEEGKVIEDIPGANIEGGFKLEDNPDVLLFRMNACNKLFRRTLFLDNGIRFRDREWYEDVSCIPKLYILADTLYYERSMWYNYLLRQGSIMNNSKLARNTEIINAVEAMNSYYKEKGVFEKYHEQLEYICYYNVLIAATVRVNLIDPDTPLQDQFLDYFLREFPNYKNNRYVKADPLKYKLLDYLITHKKRRAVHWIMSLNN
ncbi:MAG: glycosyltransferase family 2 protein, partial [Eubacteriales bacterium]|nr:glycosyltransferase family 2 protein [Eubacteriales bacterium]